MREHEIVLKRDKKLAEMKKAISGLNPTNTNNQKDGNSNLGLFHEILHYKRDEKRGLYVAK